MNICKVLEEKAKNFLETGICWVHGHTPRFASEQDLECPQGALNRSGMLNMAFKYMYGNRMVGDYLEFGAHTGRSFRIAYMHSRRAYSRRSAQFEKKIHLWAFDSFEGFPAPSEIDQFRDWNKGCLYTSADEFHRILAGAGISHEDYTVVKGFYADTLTEKLQQHMEGVKAGVILVDCDFYESTKIVLDFIVPFLQQGTVLCFDDYYCYGGSDRKGEQLAIRQFLESHKNLRLTDYYNFGWHGKSFIVQME